MNDPIYVFTTDIEWASEREIADLFDLADRHKVPLTAFLTHRSEVALERAADLGVHPNFLLGSTHGATPAEVIDHVRELLPEAVCWRAHCFRDDTRLQRLMLASGFRYDSNALHLFQDGIRPIQTAAGGWRFPVWWEDDLPMPRWTLRDRGGAPGLKVINVHPRGAQRHLVVELFEWSARFDRLTMRELYASLEARSWQ